jgi:integrase
MANRTLATVRKMLSFAVDQELIEHNPAARLGRPGGAEQSRDRVLTDAEIRTLWGSFAALSAEMGAFFKLRLVTAQRGGEVSSMRWQDVDLDSGWWTIPATRAKNKLAHRVPLSATAIDIITALRTDGVKADAYVLAGARGRRQQTEAAATFTVKDFRGHDLRRTAASLMAGGGVSRLVISRLLNHVETGVTAIYDRHSYDAEKRAALTWWDAKLAAILKNKPASVLPFTKGA